ncbi:AsnC family protein [Rathayibacter sp. YIM 133350]|uniref:AsnC family protein n=1 Tax=Rathayibacter sp. YIM 133350 TaxID=3131992 RepID=UPI00307EFC6C
MSTQLPHTLSGEFGDAEPIATLRTITQTRRDLERAESAAVRRARVAGYSWHAIADALGVSRQAAHKKHGRR